MAAASPGVAAPAYEIHFWGSIDLNPHVAEEFDWLRAEGYPIVYTGVPALMAAGDLEAVPTKWRVRAGGGADLEEV